MAFQIRYGHFEIVVMSFGLTNTLTVFIDLIDQVFNPHLDSFIVVSIDVIIIYSHNEEENMGHLRVVLQTLRNK